MPVTEYSLLVFEDKIILNNICMIKYCHVRFVRNPLSDPCNLYLVVKYSEIFPELSNIKEYERKIILIPYNIWKRHSKGSIFRLRPLNSHYINNLAYLLWKDTCKATGIRVSTGAGTGARCMHRYKMQVQCARHKVQAKGTGASTRHRCKHKLIPQTVISNPC